MRQWFLRFFGPWWGARQPRTVRLNVLEATVVAQGVVARTTLAQAVGRTVLGLAAERTSLAQATTREVLGLPGTARTVQEVL
jgi:hypothetical protein